MIIKKCDICGAENAASMSLYFGQERTGGEGGDIEHINETYELCAEHMVKAWQTYDYALNLAHTGDDVLEFSNKKVSEWIKQHNART